MQFLSSSPSSWVPGSVRAGEKPWEGPAWRVEGQTSWAGPRDKPLPLCGLCGLGCICSALPFRLIDTDKAQKVGGGFEFYVQEASRARSGLRLITQQPLCSPESGGLGLNLRSLPSLSPWHGSLCRLLSTGSPGGVASSPEAEEVWEEGVRATVPGAWGTA